MSIDIESLGFTKAELQQRVVDQICEQLLTSIYTDEDGSESPQESQFKRAIAAAVKKQTDETINALAERHLLPNVAKQIEEIVLQETNRWGEATGQSVTFIEYLTQRADAWIREEVNHNGKTKAEDGYSWTKSTTRISHMIHEHLKYSIERSMKAALELATGSVKKGLEEAVKIALANIQVKVNTEVKS